MEAGLFDTLLCDNSSPRLLAEEMVVPTTEIKDQYEMAVFRGAAVRYQVKDVARSVAFYTQHLVEMTFACAASPRGLENDWSIMAGENTIRPGSIQCPTLIIHDREDPLVPFRHAEWSHESVNGSELLEVRAGGHLIWCGAEADEMIGGELIFCRTPMTRDVLTHRLAEQRPHPILLNVKMKPDCPKNQAT